jgi:hypothetical protein
MRHPIPRKAAGDNLICDPLAFALLEQVNDAGLAAMGLDTRKIQQKQPLNFIKEHRPL